MEIGLVGLGKMGGHMAGILQTFAAKQPGPEIRITPVNMTFTYASAFGVERPPRAYAWLLRDAMQGDRTLFARFDWIARAWQLIDPLIARWAADAPRDLPNYAAGSWGPAAADELLQKDGREWRVIQATRPVYQVLAVLALPWDRIDVYLGDERAVAIDDPRSNYRMIRETLLDPAGVPPTCRHAMPAHDPSLERAALAYAEALPDRLDVLLLGIGADGHTASLFPGSSAVAERERRVVAVERPAPAPARLTITPPVIAAARRRIILACGAAKAAAVARARTGPLDVMACPAQLARPALWLLDQAATLPAGVSAWRRSPGDAPGGSGSPHSASP